MKKSNKNKHIDTGWLLPEGKGWVVGQESEMGKTDQLYGDRWTVSFWW